MTEGKRDGGGARPFQLRPSILSGGPGGGFGGPGGGFGAPFNSTKSEVSQKEFLLRPSALTSATDEKLNKKENKKRPHEEDKESSPDDSHDVNDNSVKKKILISKEESDNLTQIKEPSLKLTEDIQKPTGIGTFGFATNQSNTIKPKEDSENNFHTPNYFAQTNTADKVSFIFGNGSTSQSGGSFSALKQDENAEISNSSESNGVDTGLVINEKEKLLEQADEYQKNHVKKQQFQEVDHKTGEEGEKHVLQTFCKLFVFDKEQKIWLEKGRGTLKLNDICQTERIFQSRLVFRTQGTNLVQLNTMLWPDMCCEKVKEKNIRISAMNSETNEVSVFLISCSLKDRLQIFTAIDRRIDALKRNRYSAMKNNSPSLVSSEIAPPVNTLESSNNEDSLDHPTESNSSNEISS